MYCSHCGKKINEHALEKMQSSYVVDKNGTQAKITWKDVVISLIIALMIVGSPLIFPLFLGAFIINKLDDAVVNATDYCDENGELLLVDTEQKMEYVCPQCGHLIHEDLSEEELKSLSRAAHSQLQRGANSFAVGMALNLIGIIIGILAFSFYLLSFTSSGGGKNLDTTKSTFLVFVVMGVLAVILLGFGIYNTIVGLNKKVTYTRLLKDLNNKTFVQ